jgi:hypothetical protein
MEEAGSPETTSDDSSNPTGPATSSAPGFDLEKTKDANHRSPELSYHPFLDTTSDDAAGSEGSALPFSMYTLTEITMDDYDSQYGSVDSTNPWSQLSELHVSSTCSTSVQGVSFLVNYECQLKY